MLKSNLLYYSLCFSLALSAMNCGGEKTPVNVDPPMPIGGGCDGCDIMYEGMPHLFHAADTSVGWKEQGQKLDISGTIFQPDGKTPAADVLLYYWHADAEGLYTPGFRQSPRSAEHGHLRGWLKTGADGQYRICTVRPGIQPNSSYPAHIYMIVKEPKYDPYFIDQIVFATDTLLTDSWKRQLPNRGGTGVMDIQEENGIQRAKRNIVLGENIPGYPK
ncbi:MAG: intradiol ring-cleavage dioxygenase [Lewinellaceae bacterium]|nr:intradiol ring-cleavage dioxygenase [Lewinellaceae bacterium]